MHLLNIVLSTTHAPVELNQGSRFKAQEAGHAAGRAMSLPCAPTTGAKGKKVQRLGTPQQAAGYGVRESSTEKMSEMAASDLRARAGENKGDATPKALMDGGGLVRGEVGDSTVKGILDHQSSSDRNGAGINNDSARFFGGNDPTSGSKVTTEIPSDDGMWKEKNESQASLACNDRSDRPQTSLEENNINKPLPPSGTSLSLSETAAITVVTVESSEAENFQQRQTVNEKEDPSPHNTSYKNIGIGISQVLGTDVCSADPHLPVTNLSAPASSARMTGQGTEKRSQEAQREENLDGSESLEGSVHSRWSLPKSGYGPGGVLNEQRAVWGGVGDDDDSVGSVEQALSSSTSGMVGSNSKSPRSRVESYDLQQGPVRIGSQTEILLRYYSFTPHISSYSNNVAALCFFFFLVTAIVLLVLMK